MNLESLKELEAHTAAALLIAQQAGPAETNETAKHCRESVVEALEWATGWLHNLRKYRETGHPGELARAQSLAQNQPHTTLDCVAIEGAKSEAEVKR